MSGPEPEELRSWAEGKGLNWRPEDTFPAVTERLRLGLGVGEHRPSFRSVSDRGVVKTTGSNQKRPERQTLGVCEGDLPGGLRGRLGHHVHVSDQGAGPEDRYIAFTDTVVFAELPVRARPVFHLEGRLKGEPVKAAFTVGSDKMEGPLDSVVPAPQGSIEAGGLQWTSFPEEPEERIRRAVSLSTRSLDGLPADRIDVEYECGRLAVWIKGRAVTDGASLDSLCRFASGIAEGLADVDSATPALSSDAPLPMPKPDARTKWIDQGVELVEWEQPPVSIITAQERYKQDVKPKANRTGWKVYGIVGGALFIFSLLVAAGSLALSWAFDELPIGIVVAVISLATGTIAANRVGLEAGQDLMDDRLRSSAVPWGIEAFARGYAKQANLTLENQDELRRRLEVPFNGRPQIAWQGELSPGVTGHLSVWIDATNTPDPPRFYLLAATPPTGAPAPAGYEAKEGDGLRLTWQEVESVQRADHRLDQLREAAPK